MFNLKTIFSRKSAKAWTSVAATAATYAAISAFPPAAFIPPEITSSIVGGIFTWIVPNK